MDLSLSSASLLFFDTAPFIYYFEDNVQFAERVGRLLDRVYAADAQITTSLITYIEITTAAEKAGDRKTLARYRDYFTNSEAMSLQPFNLAIAEETVRFRAAYDLRTPDAIQLATASYCGADYVITNDRDWAKVDEFDIILIAEL